MAGEVRLNRRLYYCQRCNHDTAPLDQALGLPRYSCTAQVERHVAYLSTKEPYQEAVITLSELTGVSVSAKQAQRITLAVGHYAQEVLAQQTQAALADPELSQKQFHDPSLYAYILADGIMTPMTQGYQEAKVGAVCLFYQKTPAEEGKLLKRFYCHHLGEPIEFGKKLFGLTATAQATECAKTVALADGAAWIWRVMKRHFPHATQILDWYHAAQHLYKVAQGSLSEEMAPLLSRGVVTPAQVKQRIDEWVEDAKTVMWHGDVQTLLRLIQTLPQGNSQAKEAVRSAMTYFQNNRGRMNYPAYLDRGFKIGSGEIESGCKRLVGARMKGAGMRWKEEGAKAVGALRALLLSNRWHEVIGSWSGRPAPV